MNISDVSEKFDVAPATLRYYEQQGLIPPIARVSGVRDYSDEDCSWIEFIMCMRRAGLSIEVLREYVRLFYIGDSTAKERKQLLVEERDKLAQKITDMKATLERLNYKIEGYEKLMMPAEDRLKSKKTPFS